MPNFAERRDANSKSGLTEDWSGREIGFLVFAAGDCVQVGCYEAGPSRRTKAGLRGRDWSEQMC